MADTVVLSFQSSHHFLPHYLLETEGEGEGWEGVGYVIIIIQKAAIALEPLTTHPDEWAEPVWYMNVAEKSHITYSFFLHTTHFTTSIAKVSPHLTSHTHSQRKHTHARTHARARAHTHAHTHSTYTHTLTLHVHTHTCIAH